MKEDLTKEVLSRLDGLAAQLHTTGAQLWQVLVAQAKVEAITDLVQLGVALVAGVGGTWACFKLATLCANEADKPYKDKNEGVIISAFIGALLTGITAMIGSAVFLINSTSWVTPLLNPQYWALQQILNVFKK